MPPPYRWSSAIRGHHHFAGLCPSNHSCPSFPLAIPARRAQQAKRPAPPDRKSLQKRLEQFADNVNSHPASIGRRIDLALQSTVRRVWSSLQTTSIRILRRLDMATHTRIRSTKRAEERFRGPISPSLA